ncbi:unnamed protein product, partial [marine sediment metagenome]
MTYPTLESAKLRAIFASASLAQIEFASEKARISPFAWGTAILRA